MKVNAPCSRGVVVAQRRCPQFEHACRTEEGFRLWDAVRRSGAWIGGGMTPRRIDRAAVQERLGDVPGWIIDVLLDAFEPAALGALSSKTGKDDKPGSPSPQRSAKVDTAGGGE